MRTGRGSGGGAPAGRLRDLPGDGLPPAGSVRRLLAAAVVLCFFAAASWLPALASEQAARVAVLDLGRPPLEPPALRPAAPQGPVQAARDFFLALSAAVATTAENTRAAAEAGTGLPDASATPRGTERPVAPAPVAGGAADRGDRPPPALGEQAAAAFSLAYNYLDPGWQARMPFRTFVETWGADRRLDLLAALPAGHPPGAPRTGRAFVEVRSLVGLADGTAVVYAYGFFLAASGREGWRLLKGQLRREQFAPLTGIGVAETPEAVALAAARGRAAAGGRPAAPVGPVRVQPGADHTAEAKLTLGGRTYLIRLYRLVDGGWVALDTVD